MVALDGILEAKLAITVLPLLAVPGHMHPALVFRKLTNPRIERELCVITRRDYQLPAAAQMVHDLLFDETPHYAK
jgi:DNA-binding transcriptional LysR family regulator